MHPPRPNRRLPRLLAAAALLMLSACSNPLSTGRYLIDPPDLADSVANRLGTAELLDVSLPDYAQGDEIAFQDKDGSVRSTPKQLWADTPGRAFTVTLARAASEVSGATVIPEPWPLAEPPRRRIRVDVEKALAGRDGIYRLTGRYYVSDERGGGSNQARSFALGVPVTDTGPRGIAAAQSAAIAQLARQMAVLGGPGTTVATSTTADPFVLPLPPLDPIALEPTS